MIALLLALTLGDWPTVAASMANKVPRLEMKKGDSRGICSGAVFLIEDGWAYALTAAHCVTHEPTERFDLTANDRHAAAVDSNNLLDLAVVRFRAHREQVIPLAPLPPAAGADVAVVGYAFGVEELVVQFGHIAQQRNKETKTVWIDCMTIFGDSGGAIVDDQGRLVAITSAIYSGGLLGQSAHIGAAVTLDAVKDFIGDFAEKLKKAAK